MKSSIKEAMTYDDFSIEVGNFSENEKQIVFRFPEKDYELKGKMHTVEGRAVLLFNLGELKEIISNLEIIYDSKVFIENIKERNNGR